MPLKQPLFRSIWIVARTSDILRLDAERRSWLADGFTNIFAHDGRVGATRNKSANFSSLPPRRGVGQCRRPKAPPACHYDLDAVFSAVLGVLTVAGTINAWGLLAFTLLIGAGAALESPAWQAITPELNRS